MAREKKIFAPRLYPVSRDLGKEWFISYKTPDYDKGEFKKNRYLGYLNLEPDYDQRLIMAFDYLLLLRADIVPPNVIGARYIKPKTESKSFADTEKIFTKYLQVMCKDLNKPAIKAYTSKMNIFRIWLSEMHYDILPIGVFGRAHAIEFSDWLIDIWGVSPGTHNSYMNSMGLIFKEILYYLPEIKTPNPFAEVKRKKGKAIPLEAHPKSLRVHVAKTLPTENVQLWIAIQFVYYHFIRIVELTRIRIEDLDFENGTILIRDDVNRKSGQGRLMAIRADLLNYMLSQNYHLSPPGDYLFGKHGEPGPEPVSTNGLRLQWIAYKTRHNIPEKYKLYAVKRNGNTSMAVSGLSAQEQMLNNGHGTLAMTQIYIDRNAVDLPKLRRVAEAMEAF